MGRLLPVFVIVLVDLLGLTIIIPLLPLYAASFGANAFVIGVLGATYPIMQLIGAPILGRLSDRYGRKPVLVVSQIGTFIGFILMGFANALPLLFLARIIDGVSGANIATAQAVITDNTNDKTRTSGLAPDRRSVWPWIHHRACHCLRHTRFERQQLPGAGVCGSRLLAAVAAAHCFLAEGIAAGGAARQGK